MTIRYTEVNFTFLGLQILNLIFRGEDNTFHNFLLLKSRPAPFHVFPTPDVELQSLAPLDGGSAELVERFIDILIAAVKLKGNYDVLQAYINVFLKVSILSSCMLGR